MTQMRLLADEVLLLHGRPLHPGLDDVVLASRARRRRRGSPSRAGRSSRRRRSRRRSARAARPPPRARPRGGRPARSARTAPSRGRRRTRSATRARAASRSRSCGSAPNGKPSCETSSEVTLARMSRARGPQSPIVVHAVVTSTSDAEPSSGSASRRACGRPCRARRRSRCGTPRRRAA